MYKLVFVFVLSVCGFHVENANFSIEIPNNMFDPSEIRAPRGKPPTYNYSDGGDIPHFTGIVYGTWNIIYSWPPLETPRKAADFLTFIAPSKLESAVFSCRCAEENPDFLAPIKIEDSAKKVRVFATQMVNSEEEVLSALNRVTCGCRELPLASKFVLLPLNEDYVLKYIRLPNAEYTSKNPCHVYLLHKDLPSAQEVHTNLEGLELCRRKGAPTYIMMEP